MKNILVLAISLIALCSCTESAQRSLKSIRSNWNGGLERKVEVFDYSGNLIKVYQGKFDVQETSNNYIYFDMADGRRIIVHGGIIVNEEIIK